MASAEDDIMIWRPGVEPENEEEVQELIKNISANNGYLSEEDREYLRAKPHLLSLVQSQKITIAALAEKLSVDLYQSDSRFLYELIQNADDNLYTRVKEAGQDPELVITLSEDRLVFETNENGFKRADVEAISKIGKSTKKSTDEQAYIGEKGIGFKSVFKVADKVHIKSNLYSFSFRFNRSDKTLGGYSTIAPIPEPYEDMPEHGSRITLTQFYGIDFKSLKADLKEIPNALLLFLRQLKKLKICIESQEQTEETCWTKNETVIAGFEEIKMSHSIIMKKSNVTISPKSKITRQLFLVQRKIIKNLPKDKARLIKNTDRYITSAQVVVAFPLDEECRPHIEDQYGYAFLPMSKFGFTFLIQSDFVTLPSREDVMDSERNRALLDGIAATFGDAVEEFCKHKPLRYSWMRFLPSDRTSSPFWRKLGSKIHDVLRSRSILEPFTDEINQNTFPTTKVLRKVATVFIIPNSFLDSANRPLLRAADPISYLSLNYNSDDQAKLRWIGVTDLDSSNILDLLEHDLKNEQSYWRSLERSTEWQGRVSEALIRVCDIVECKRRIKDMKIVALTYGSWVSPAGQDLLFPRSGKANIPTDLKMRLVHEDSIKAPQRSSLMAKLGVKHASPSQVVQKIIRKHGERDPYHLLNDGVSHLIYLFWHGEGCLKPSDWRRVKPFSREGGTMEAEYMFLPRREDNLGPEKLFEKATIRDVPVPGFTTFFLHDYLVNPIGCDAINENGQKWMDWLVSTLGVLEMPRLSIEARSGPVFSPEFEYIMQHRPDSIVPLLHKHQSLYTPVPESLLPSLCKVKVASQNGKLTELQASILPTKELCEIAEGLDLLNLPFLAINQTVSEPKMKDWEFLRQFKVETVASIAFYVYCLKALVDSKQHSKAFECAINIYTKIESLYKKTEIPTLRKSLDWAWICVPLNNGRVRWLHQKDCVWKGPDWLTCKYVLDGYAQWRPLYDFGQKVMEIKDASWGNYIAELVKMKGETTVDFEKVTQVYKALWAEFKEDKTGMTLRNELEDQQLVYTNHAGWLAPSICVWASKKIKIEGKICIQDSYNTSKELSDMFLKGLKIPKPSLEMHLATLTKLAKNQASESAIIDIMAHISELKPPEGTLKSKLQNSNIFPIQKRTGDISRTSLSVEFAIIDKTIYRGLFESSVHVLNFTDEDFWRTRDFLIACGLRSRFMSECVREKTAAADSTILEAKTREMRSKAYAFLRYAVHFRSTRTQESHENLHQLLRRISIFKSTNITKSLSITQSMQTFEIVLEKSDVHLDDEDPLNIYVPKDSKGFSRSWPRDVLPRFKSWIGVSTPLGDYVLQSIFSRDDLELLDEDLELSGIIKVPGAQRDPVNGQSIIPSIEELEIYNPLQDNSPILFDVGNSASAYMNVSRTTGSRSASHATYTPGMSFAGNTIDPDSNGYGHYDNAIQDQNEAYRTVLNGVIDAAQSMFIHDRCGALPQRLANRAVDNLERAFGPTFLNGVGRNQRRDCRVGAAGELFVFEVLKKLGLPDFNTENWRSTIRHEVCVHQKYANMAQFRGTETSDIVYSDTTGFLTNLLHETQHLDVTSLGNRTPKYFIEVKTTTEAYDDPLFISAAQYKRMKETRSTGDLQTPEIYIIMRVFNLGQPDSINIRVYLDPWGARERDELIFTASNWSVRPSAPRTPTKFPKNPSDGSNPGTLGGSNDSSAWKAAPSSKEAGPFSHAIETISGIEEHYHSIGHAPQFWKWSHEELRLADYELGAGPKISTSGTSSLFGQNPSTFYRNSFIFPPINPWSTAAPKSGATNVFGTP